MTLLVISEHEGSISEKVKLSQLTVESWLLKRKIGNNGLLIVVLVVKYEGARVLVIQSAILSVVVIVFIWFSLMILSRLFPRE